MAYSALKLITRSWYLSNIVARNAQVPTGDQINDGLDLLNSLLDFKSVQIDLIPYWTYDTSYATVAGQEDYFIANCVAIESVTFTLQTVRYATDYTTRRNYYGSTRVNSVESLPFNWYFNRELGGGNLSLYFIPDQVYPLQIMGKFALTNVALNTDLETVYDGSYIEYLRYMLAKYMCSEYGILFNPDSEGLLKQMSRQLMDVSPPDLSMRKSSILRQGPGLNFGDVNIGRGWRPS